MTTQHVQTSEPAAAPPGPQPLEGLRLIEISTYVAGPSGAMTLAQLGAEVIRVDPIGGATDTRRLPLDAKGNSLYWAGLNKGKRSVEIDTSTEEGRQLVFDLLAAPGADNGILLTNAVGQRWLDYDNLLPVPARPDHGPHPRSQRRQAGRRLHGQQRGGAAVHHRPGRLRHARQPRAAGLGPARPAGTPRSAVLAAERLRNRTGRGQKVTVSLANVAIATMAHLGFVADVVVNGRRPAAGGQLPLRQLRLRLLHHSTAAR